MLRRRQKANASAGDEEFAVGDKVRHAKFGEGLIIDQDGKTLTVIFDAAGQKKMAKGIAPLKKALAESSLNHDFRFHF